jgi:hypothetical protein
MPVLPQPHRLSLHEAINYVAERCNSEPVKAGKAVHSALGEGALVASANVLVSDRSYEAGIVAGPLPVGPPRRVEAGIDRVPSELWAKNPWPEFLRRAVRPRSNPMFKGQPGTPIYSNPTIATADIDAWLDRSHSSREVPADTSREEGLGRTVYGAIQMKPGALGFAIDLKPIFEYFSRFLRFRK